jgi:hypothetical protein
MKRVSPQEQERQRLAYHEAAHAVAAYLHGYRVVRVWIDPLGAGKPYPTIQGTTEFHNDRSNRDAWMKIVLAPDGVERRLCRERGWPLWPGDPEDWEISDWWQITFGPSRLREEMGWRSVRRYKMAYEWSAAFANDDANWRAVTAVAEALLSSPVRDDGTMRLSFPTVGPIIYRALKESAA